MGEFETKAPSLSLDEPRPLDPLYQRWSGRESEIEADISQTIYTSQRYSLTGKRGEPVVREMRNKKKVVAYAANKGNELLSIEILQGEEAEDERGVINNFVHSGEHVVRLLGSYESTNIVTLLSRVGNEGRVTYLTPVPHLEDQLFDNIFDLFVNFHNLKGEVEDVGFRYQLLPPKFAEEMRNFLSTPYVNDLDFYTAGYDAEGRTQLQDAFYKRYPLSLTQSEVPKILGLVETDSVDVVVELDRFSRVPEAEKEKFLQEMDRVLKPGGRILIRENSRQQAEIEYYGQGVFEEGYVRSTLKGLNHGSRWIILHKVDSPEQVSESPTIHYSDQTLIQSAKDERIVAELELKFQRRLARKIAKSRRRELIEESVGPEREEAISPLVSTEGLVQNFDHPILDRKQERYLLRLYSEGATINELKANDAFLASFKPDEKLRMNRLLVESNNLEEVIASCYLRLVRSIAGRYYRALPFNDAINTGNEGLIRTIREWDITRGNRFSTRAVWRIRAAITAEIRDHYQAIRVPAYVYQDLAAARRVRGTFQGLFGRLPTPDELKSQLLATTGINRARANTAVRVLNSGLQFVDSLNELASNEKNSAEKGDLVPDFRFDPQAVVIERIAQQELKAEMQRALKEHLTDEEQHVMRVLYGLQDMREEMISEASGVKREDAKYIERISLLKLRRDRRLREHWEKDIPSFVYNRSAESAALRLGLLDEIMSPEGIDEAIAEIEGKRQAQVAERRQRSSVYAKERTLRLKENPTVRTREFDQEVAELRLLGLTNAEIATSLHKSRATINASITRLIEAEQIEAHSTGLHPATQRLFDAVEAVAKSGARVTNAELARILSTQLRREISEGRVIQVKIALASAGKIKRYTRTPEEIALMDSRVGNLRKDHPELTKSEMARQLGCKEWEVSGSLHRLLQSNRVASKESDQKARKEYLQYLEGHREEKINMSDAARKIGVSRERIRQIHNKLKDEKD